MLRLTAVHQDKDYMCEDSEVAFTDIRTNASSASYLYKISSKSQKEMSPDSVFFL